MAEKKMDIETFTGWLEASDISYELTPDIEVLEGGWIKRCGYTSLPDELVCVAGEKGPGPRRIPHEPPKNEWVTLSPDELDAIIAENEQRERLNNIQRGKSLSDADWASL